MEQFSLADFKAQVEKIKQSIAEKQASATSSEAKVIKNETISLNVSSEQEDSESEDIPKYCDIISDESVQIIKSFLRSVNKKDPTKNDILYGELNPSIDYNQIISKILEGFDSAIELLIESTAENDKSLAAQKKIEDVFLKNGVIYDYIMVSGIFDRYAKLFNVPACPVSEIPNDQKIIIKDERSLKTSSIDLKGVQTYYTKVEPLS